MSIAVNWRVFDHGATIGTRGSENGVILRDEVYDDTARITLERDGHTPFAITCGCCGMVHTRFFATEAEAQTAFEQMKNALVRIAILAEEVGDAGYNMQVVPAIEQFIEQFP